ncbi:50S ribosomal protein L31e [Candidatus Woesearchaeota archaeon]|nr:50S ribosomal protein L31e [Candidatus Woesearchaeota archaeon]
MATKKEAVTKLERTYNIPLRREYLKVPYWKRTNKAVIAAKEFLVKHMKSENVILGKALNEKIWQHGIRNPPHHVKVVAVRDEKGVVRAELFGAEDKKKVKKETKKKVSAKKVEAPKEEVEQ